MTDAPAAACYRPAGPTPARAVEEPGTSPAWILRRSQRSETAKRIELAPGRLGQLVQARPVNALTAVRPDPQRC
ncbi:hypothetical protein [Rhodococcus sp. 1168]|uniref:hypothetical protein n=1 Tax=Rhodococcus sp. 1168 TaxID=2018041 RepID=UPI000F741612|nr:hypothetical protein [Rhodococcus sp. 1168]